jgi:hypothetical protein
MRDLVLTTFALIFMALLAPASADELKADLETGKKLLDEGDALADKQESTEATLRYKQAFEHLLPTMRKIPFKTEVKRDVTDRGALQDVMLKEFEEEMTPAEFHASELGMKALGFISRTLDFKGLMIKAYSEEIAAFYDPRTKTMHLIKEPEEALKKPLTLIERALGKTNGFNKDENKTVIAHELTHALADQNFDLYALQKSIKNDDDRSLALSSLIEGEATLTMVGAQMSDWQGEKIAKIPAANLERTFGLLMSFMPLAGGKTLREAPPILSESMMFPYVRGMVFCASQTNNGGWKALDDAYRNPPLSTEQILHPEKYGANPDVPMAIDLGSLTIADPWKELGRNVVGEMQTGILLRKHGGKGAAVGWDGDQFAVFEAPDDRIGLVWFSTWDTPEDAKRFANAYARFQSTKFGADVPKPDDVPDSLRRSHEDVVYAIERQGADVVIVEGFSAELTESLLGDSRHATKTVKTHRSVSPEAAEPGQATR